MVHVFAYVDSCNRDTGSLNSSNFQYSFNLPKLMNYKSVALVHASFLKGYYMVDSTNNTFGLDDSGAPVTVTLTAGRNYSATQLATELKTKMDLAGADVYTVTFSSNTGKFTIANGTGDFTIDLASNGDIARYIGHAKEDAIASASSSLVSTKVVDLQRYCSVYIRTSLCKNGNDNILEQLLIRDTADLDAFTWEPNMRNYRDVVNPDSNMHSFWITDIDGQGIDLNGSEIQLGLILST